MLDINKSCLFLIVNKVCLDILHPNINKCCGNKQISNLVNRNLICRCASAYTEICAKTNFDTYGCGLGTKLAG